MSSVFAIAPYCFKLSSASLSNLVQVASGMSKSDRPLQRRGLTADRKESHHKNGQQQPWAEEQNQRKQFTRFHRSILQGS